MSCDWLKDWFFRSTILPHKKVLMFLLGFLTAALSLASTLLEEVRVAEVFIVAFALCLIVLLCVRPDRFKDVVFDKSRWAIFSIAVLGFGSGALLFHYRGWLVWLWSQLSKIDSNQKVLLTSLFLLGVIMGFFVVRNWSKDQKDFLASLSAVIGGAFLSSVIGEFAKDGTAEGGMGLAKWLTFTYYFLGFTISGALNLLVFTFLAARYTSNQSAISRAIIDLLYGSDKASAIDAYFLRSFEDDLDYAKSALLNTLKAYREVIKVQLAGKFQTQWKGEEERRERKEREGKEGEEKKRYFVLLSVGLKDKPALPESAHSGVRGAHATPSVLKDQFVVRFRELRKKEEIKPEMFRVAVSMRWRDTLEYVVAPGEYRKSFPYFGSVAGLALLSRSTIVMDRDRLKKFRSEQYISGKTPSEAQQPRGLNQIDYVSYVAIPLVSNFGKQEETELGILHVDTKLFAAPGIPEGAIQDDLRDPSFFQMTRSREQLEDDLGDWGCRIYNVEDKIIKFLEEMRAVIIPVLQLYKKCRTGAGKRDLTPGAKSG
jgi:hypothetical protein